MSYRTFQVGEVVSYKFGYGGAFTPAVHRGEIVKIHPSTSGGVNLVVINPGDDKAREQWKEGGKVGTFISDYQVID